MPTNTFEGRLAHQQQMILNHLSYTFRKLAAGFQHTLLDIICIHKTTHRKERFCSLCYNAIWYVRVNAIGGTILLYWPLIIPLSAAFVSDKDPSTNTLTNFWINKMVCSHCANIGAQIEHVWYNIIKFLYWQCTSAWEWQFNFLSNWSECTTCVSSGICIHGVPINCVTLNKQTTSGVLVSNNWHTAK